MSCKWCGSKQAFYDLDDGTKECKDCYILRKAIENSPKEAETMINSIKETQ